MIIGKILNYNLLIGALIFAISLHAQKVDTKKLIVQAIVSKDLFSLKKMFERELFISNGFDVQFSITNDYDGFGNKKGDLYKVLFDSSFAKKYFGIEKVQSFQEMLQENSKSVQFFEGNEELSELNFENDALIYKISLQCSKKQLCKIKVFEIVEK